VLVGVSAAFGFILAGVLQNRTTQGFWDIAAQPIATAGAGFLAVGAATVALIGVFITQGTNVRTTRAQLRHQRSALLRQDRLEEEKHERQAKHEAKIIAANAIVALTTASTAVNEAIARKKARQAKAEGAPANPLAALGTADPVTAAIRACQEVRDACTASAVVLLVVGERDAYLKTQDYANGVGRWLTTTAKDRDEISIAEVLEHGMLRTAAIAAIAQVSPEEVGGVPATGRRERTS